MALSPEKSFSAQFLEAMNFHSNLPVYLNQQRETIYSKVKEALKKELETWHWRVFIAEENRIVIEKERDSTNDESEGQLQFANIKSEMLLETFAPLTLSLDADFLNQQSFAGGNKVSDEGDSSRLSLPLDFEDVTLDLPEPSPEVNTPSRRRQRKAKLKSGSTSAPAVIKKNLISSDRKRHEKHERLKKILLEKCLAVVAPEERLEEQQLSQEHRVSIDTSKKVKKNPELEINTVISIAPKRRLNDKTFKTHQCNRCELSFTSVVKLNQHQTKPHSEVRRENVEKSSTESFLCVVCGLAFDDEKGLKTHMKNHSKKNDVPSKPITCLCLTCGKSFQSLVHLGKHKFRHLDENEPNKDLDTNPEEGEVEDGEILETKTLSNGKNHYPCKTCGKIFSTPGNRSRHNSASHRGRKFLCKLCGKSLSGDLKTHMDSVHLKKQKICEQCGKGFSNHSNLRMHYKQHHMFCPFLCKRCGRDFETEEELNDHRETAHMERKERVQCTICLKEYAKGRIRTHIAIVHENKRYSCEICYKDFTQKKRLRSHMDSIHDKKKIPCAYDRCGKQFSRIEYLKNHMKSSHGGLPVIVPIVLPTKPKFVGMECDDEMANILEDEFPEQDPPLLIHARQHLYPELVTHPSLPSNPVPVFHITTPSSPPSANLDELPPMPNLHPAHLLGRQLPSPNPTDSLLHQQLLQVSIPGHGNTVTLPVVNGTIII